MNTIWIWLLISIIVTSGPVVGQSAPDISRHITFNCPACSETRLVTARIVAV